MQFSNSCRCKYIIAAITLSLIYSHEAGAVGLPPPSDGPPPPVLTSIGLSGSMGVDEKTAEQYLCTASYSDGTSADVDAFWSDDSPDATIDNSGTLTVGDVNADQEITLTASYGGKSDTLLVVVADIPVVLTSIEISGPTSLDEGTTASYVCTASYSDGTSEVVTPNWDESSVYTAIDSSGLLSAGNVTTDQNVTLTASFDGVTDTYAVTVRYIVPVLTGIIISGPQSLDEKTTAQYVCTASYTDGTTMEVTPSWNENSAYASIKGTGLLSAGDVVSSHSVLVTASYGGKNDTHAVTINNVVELTSITISGPANIEENANAQYICTAHYAEAPSAQVDAVWSVVDSTFAAVDGSGLISAGNITSDEQVTIRASFDGQEAVYTLSIMAIGNQVVFPLSGFDGKTVYAVLWDSVVQSNIVEEFSFEPEEFVIENVNSNQWYWLGLSEYDDGAGTTNLLHGLWIWM